MLSLWCWAQQAYPPRPAYLKRKPDLSICLIDPAGHSFFINLGWTSLVAGFLKQKAREENMFSDVIPKGNKMA